jgi:Fur family peroxide stress response transcriptional regulator
MKKDITKYNLDQLKQLCSEVGIKLTHQRLEIFKEVLAATDHPSAELIHRRLQVKMPTIAIDTVYRTLATFAELDIVKKLHVSNQRTRFDSNLDTHHHFIFTRCKKVTDLYWTDFDNTNLPDNISKLGEVSTRHLELHGVCADCLKAASQK